LQVANVKSIVSGLTEDLLQLPGIVHCLSEISRASDWQFALADSLGGIKESLSDIFRNEVRVGIENLVMRHSFASHTHDRRHGNSQSTYAGSPPI
jgi:hypothetical protein